MPQQRSARAQSTSQPLWRSTLTVALAGAGSWYSNMHVGKIVTDRVGAATASSVPA